MAERISIMIKNKVVIKERDAWSDLANFIGEMVAKYADAMELDKLPNPDNYLRMKRIKQLYMELYKQRCTRGYKRYKETSGLIEWKECQIFHSIFT